MKKSIRKTARKILSMILVFAITLTHTLPFMPIKTAYAQEGKITLQLDNGTISGNVITFDVEGTNVTATVSGNGWTANGNNRVEIDASEINTLVFAFGEGFDRDNMSVDLHNDQHVTINGDNEAIFGDLDFTIDDAPHLQVSRIHNNENPGGGEPGGGDHGGDNTQNHIGNGTSTLNYSINGAIEYSSGGGFDHGITFRINGIRYAADESKMHYTEGPAYERDENGQVILDSNNNPIVIKDPETYQPMTEKTGLSIVGDTIHYDYDTNTNKVEFVFAMAPGTLISALRINGQTINNLPKTSEELMNCYTDHRSEIVVSDIDKADTYDIEIEARYPNKSEEYMGNFLWDYNPEGYTSPEDKILNATLTLVEAEYDGHKWTTENEINSLGGVYIWKDANRTKEYVNERDGVGEAQFPIGTKLTVRIIPDAGYQLVDFGINGGVFEPQEEIGTYTFEVEGGPFHLQATIQKVEDAVKTTSKIIKSGSILLGDNEESMAVGSARLDVGDIKPSETQVGNFEKTANGYKISDYIDISLFNTVYKGKTSESWDTEVKDLNDEATITLKLEGVGDNEEVAIVHEKHDGTYEVIPAVYDAKAGTVTFKTKSFSNYAIATKASTSSNPKTGDNIMLYISLLGLSVTGLTGTGLHIKKRRYN